jgi:hypothetical protein
VVNLKLSPDEFWGLSWYEYDLYLQRFEQEQQKEKFYWESNWDRTRHLWAVLINTNSKTKVKPSDLIKLSFDKPKKKKDEKPLTPKEMKEPFGSKFQK